MSVEHERLEREHQRLQPKNQCVHEAKSVHSVKSDPLEDTRLFGRDHVVIVGIGIGDAAASCRDPSSPPFRAAREAP
jgi:hypothetical protein